MYILSSSLQHRFQVISSRSSSKSYSLTSRSIRWLALLGSLFSQIWKVKSTSAIFSIHDFVSSSLDSLCSSSTYQPLPSSPYMTSPLRFHVIFFSDFFHHTNLLVDTLVETSSLLNFVAEIDFRISGVLQKENVIIKFQIKLILLF